jgi:hypothetical protein
MGDLASRAASRAILGQIWSIEGRDPMILLATTVEDEVTWAYQSRVMPGVCDESTYVYSWDGIAYGFGTNMLVLSPLYTHSRDGFTILLSVVEQSFDVVLELSIRKFRSFLQSKHTPTMT